MQLGQVISGDDLVVRVFANLPRTTQNWAARPALRAGARVVRNAAEANVRSQVSDEATGTLARNIVVRPLKNKKGHLRVAVQIRPGALNQLKKVRGVPVRVGLYAGVLEYRDGGSKSWIRKAAREKESQAAYVVAVELKRRMPDAISKARR